MQYAALKSAAFNAGWEACMYNSCRESGRVRDLADYLALTEGPPISPQPVSVPYLLPERRGLPRTPTPVEQLVADKSLE